MSRKGIFSEHVRLLALGTPLPDDHFDVLWQALRAVLVSELRKRSLWTASPAYLGVYGGDSWSREEILEELLVECYTAAFLRRLRSLHAQLRVRPSIDGLIFLNVRNFLHDTQKKHDPLGFRLFTVLRAAIRTLLDQKTLHRVAGDEEIRKDTVVGFRSGASDVRAGSSELTQRAKELADVFLPDLITALGKAQVKLIGRLAEYLAGWQEDGMAAFRFHDLLTPLSNDVRRRWADIWRQEEGDMAPDDRVEELAGLVRLVQPDSGFEERQSFYALLACVEAALDRTSLEDPVLHDNLRRLWLLLRDHATAPDAGEALPSKRRMAATLEIPRDRLRKLNVSLGRMVEGCRDGAPAGDGIESGKGADHG